MKHLSFAVAALAIAAQSAMAADPAKIDWSAVPATQVGLFYPGQSTYQWVRSKAHKGANKIKKGDACVTCHDSDTEEKDMGENLVKGGKLEPTPVTGKPGSKTLKVQAAYDDKNAYLRFEWKTANPYPGTEYQYLRFDGKEWKVYGFPKLDKVVQEGKQPGIYEDRMSIMIDDGKVPGFAQQGCWLTCHDGERDMPNFADKEEVAANPLLSALKKNDVRKYLPEHPHQPVGLEHRQVGRRDRQDQGRGRLRRPDPVARAPLQPGGHGGRRLRARMAQLRRRQEHVRGAISTRRRKQPKFM